MAETAGRELGRFPRAGFWLLGALLLAATGGLTLVNRHRPTGQAPDVPPPLFVNAAGPAGIRFELPDPDHLLNILEATGSGCAFLDYNRDGFLDALLVARGRCVLYRNDGQGAFRDVTVETGLKQDGHWIGCAAADYDNDGYPDLLLNGYGCLRLLHNEGGRSFHDVTPLLPPQPKSRTPLWGTSAAWGDVDRDGWLDLYIARYVAFRPDTEQFCRGQSGHMETCQPASYEPQFGVLYRNERGARFVDATHRLGADRTHGKAWSGMFFDADGDGWQDLYVANDELPGDLLRNERGTGFKNTAEPSGVAFDADGRMHGAMGIDAGDFNGDGRLDLVVTTFMDEPYSLYRQNTDGTFTDVAALSSIAAPTRPTVGWGTRFLDFDNDGRPDLLFVNGQATDSDRHPECRIDMAQSMQLFRNLGGRFEAVPLGPLEAPIVGRGAAFGDYDNDGFPDVLVVDMEGPALLLHNTEGARRPHAHWLGISLTGTRSNRDGLGARVEVRSGGKTQVAEAQTCGSVFSSNDPRLRFGLGPETLVDEVTVRWPSGTTDRLTGVPADHYMSLTEGSTAR